MTVEVINCVQGTEEWHLCRLGLPTASEFSTICATGRGGSESKTRALYLKKLAGEIITGIPREEYRNAQMDRGNAMEAEIRNLYQMATNEDVVEVGFLRNGRKGASPDGLVGTAGMVEIKTQAPHLLIDRLLSSEVPPEHMAQCQGSLWVGEREWIDICVGYKKMPLFKKRIARSELYIARLRLAVDVFLEELDALVAKVRQL